MWQEVTSYLLCWFVFKDISKAVSNNKNESIQKNSRNERTLGAGRKWVNILRGNCTWSFLVFFYSYFIWHDILCLVCFSWCLTALWPWKKTRTRTELTPANCCLLRCDLNEWMRPKVVLWPWKKTRTRTELTPANCCLLRCDLNEWMRPKVVAL
jgi:hypothetical protein